jgi:hypothetical protein
MALHKWRRRPTKYFGDVWVPFAQIDLRSMDGRFQSLALQIDSGAVASLLRRSVAELLGLELEAGRQVALGSIGGQSIKGFVHDIPTRSRRQRYDESNYALQVPIAGWAR